MTIKKHLKIIEDDLDELGPFNPPVFLKNQAERILKKEKN